MPSFHNTRRAMEEGIVLRIRRRYFTDGFYGNDIRTIRHSWCCSLGFGGFFLLPLQNPKLARVLCCSPSRAFTQTAATGMGLPLRSANERSLAFGAESSTTSSNNASVITTLLYLSKVYRFNDTRLLLNHKLSHLISLLSPFSETKSRTLLQQYQKTPFVAPPTIAFAKKHDVYRMLACWLAVGKNLIDYYE